MFRKTLIFIAAAAMSFAACSRDSIIPENLTTSFSVCTDVVPGTRAVVDEDGAAAGVTRFIMEVYRNHDGLSELYTREAKFNAGGMHETTFDVKFLKDQEYDVLFWADCATAADGDLYYDTATGGLKNIVFKGEYIGNDDSRDAFSAAVKVSVGKAAVPQQTVVLYRPFGQLNIITDDIDNLAETTASGMAVCPDAVKVKYSACNAFNVLTQLAGGSAEFEYKAVPYFQLRDSVKSAAADKFTLSMDYILASKGEQDIHNVTMTASQDGYQLCTTIFENIPVQRNYRTNIYGSLLTVTDKFVVIIDENWLSPDNDIDFE